jgi:hypothetical protein
MTMTQKIQADAGIAKMHKLHLRAGPPATAEISRTSNLSTHDYAACLAAKTCE